MLRRSVYVKFPTKKVLYILFVVLTVSRVIVNKACRQELHCSLYAHPPPAHTASHGRSCCAFWYISECGRSIFVELLKFKWRFAVTVLTTYNENVFWFYNIRGLTCWSHIVWLHRYQIKLLHILFCYDWFAKRRETNCLSEDYG